MAISAKLVKELREKTGSGMMDCKKAFEEANGDVEKATNKRIIDNNDKENDTIHIFLYSILLSHLRAKAKLSLNVLYLKHFPV